MNDNERKKFMHDIRVKEKPQYDEEKELKKWKKLINSFCNKLYDDERKFYYYFIKYKYFIKKDDEFIKEHMNLNNNEFNQINNYLKWVIYQYAVIDDLYSERRLYS